MEHEIFTAFPDLVKFQNCLKKKHDSILYITFICLSYCIGLLFTSVAVGDFHVEHEIVQLTNVNEVGSFHCLILACKQAK